VSCIGVDRLLRCVITANGHCRGTVSSLGSSPSPLAATSALEHAGFDPDTAAGEIGPPPQFLTVGVPPAALSVSLASQLDAEPARRDQKPGDPRQQPFPRAPTVSAACHHRRSPPPRLSPPQALDAEPLDEYQEPPSSEAFEQQQENFEEGKYNMNILSLLNIISYCILILYAYKDFLATFILYT
jgi:hypothetical protein